MNVTSVVGSTGTAIDRSERGQEERAGSRVRHTERVARSAAVSLGVVLVVFVLVRTAPVSAQSSRRRGRTPIASTAVPTVIGSAVALAAGVALFATTQQTQTGSASTWRGGIVLDEGVRDGLRLQAPDARDAAARASDVLMIAGMLNAVAIDAFAIPLAQDDPHLAWQASTAYSLALGITLVLNDVVKESVGRARPYERECRQDPSSPACTSQDTYASFYSGHTAVAFTSAGFSCAMHLSRSLYGDDAADGASCGASLAVAAMTGLLRIASDRHYLSDVAIGAVIGFLVGYIVPLIFVPERAPLPETEVDPETVGDEIAAPLPGPSAIMVPMYSPGPEGLGSGTIGLSVSGTF